MGSCLGHRPHGVYHAPGYGPTLIVQPRHHHHGGFNHGFHHGGFGHHGHHGHHGGFHGHHGHR